MEELASGDFEQDSRLDVSGLNLNAALDIGGMQPTLGGVAKGLMPATAYFGGFNTDDRITGFL